MRIFRQQKFMEWIPVFDRIAVELRKTVPSTVPTPSMAVETAPGELIDKITILEIKAEWMGDSKKVRNVRTELDTLCRARDRTILPSDRLASLTAELRPSMRRCGTSKTRSEAASGRETSVRSSSSWRGRSTSIMTPGRDQAEDQCAAGVEVDRGEVV